jgi:uncharacterized protein YegL
VPVLLDTSGWMSRQPIRQLNAGIQSFKQELMADRMAAKRVEVAIITFGPVQSITEFQTADQFMSPTLHTTGDTPMGAAIEQGVLVMLA